MKIDGETKMRMIKKELGQDPESQKRDRLINGALAVVILFVPIYVISTVLYQWITILS